MFKKRTLKAVFLTIFLLIIIGSTPVAGQDVEMDIGFQEGVGFSVPEKGMGFAFNLRMQQQVEWYSERLEEEGLSNTQFSTMLRRNRFTFSGYANDREFSFLVMPSYDRGEPDLELAKFNWKIQENTRLTFGQFKLPFTREFLISSGTISMVDRSFVDSRFRQLYDIGFKVQQTITLDPTVVTFTGALTSGEGANKPTGVGGYNYTVRAEWMPFGKFDAYMASDFEQSKEPRLALAAAVNYNNDAHRAGGSVGRFLGDRIDRINLVGYSIDGVYKQHGLTVMGQLNHRRVDGNNPYSAFEGSGYMFQSGYMTSENTELTARHGYYWPSANVETAFQAQRRWVIGWSRYMEGHDMKIQADAGLIERFGEIPRPDRIDLLARMLFQLDF